MKTSELRIGNYVIIPAYDIDAENNIIGDSENDEIIKITIDELIIIESNYKDCIGEYKPIPITADILLKCGFSFEDKDALYWVKGAFNLEKDVVGKFWFEVYSHYNELKYLHQLQNLYFALTNEELTINL